MISPMISTTTIFVLLLCGRQWYQVWRVFAFLEVTLLSSETEFSILRKSVTE